MRGRDVLMIAGAAGAASGAVAATASAETLHQNGAIEAQALRPQMTLDEFVKNELNRSAANPVAQAAEVFHWENVGGAPLVKGGVHSRSAAAAVLGSEVGTKAMKREGLNARERTAVRKALGKKGKGMYKTHIPPNVELPKMVSKDYETKGPVILDGEKYKDGIPAFCVKAISRFTKGGKKIKETITQCLAETCANAVLMGKDTTATEVPKTPAKKPKKAEVGFDKLVKDSAGHLVPAAQRPTGIFHAELDCTQNGRELKRVVTINRYPQVLGLCDIGKPRFVQEMHTDGWTIEGFEDQVPAIAAIQKAIVFKDPKKNVATFVNRENPVVLPPEGPKDTPKGDCNGDTTNTATDTSGNTIQTGNCPIIIIKPPTPPTDVCPNIPGTQIAIPEGYTLDENGFCVPKHPGTPKNPPTIKLVQKTPQFEGVDEGDKIEICADAASNPVANGVTVIFSAKYSKLDNPRMDDGEFCVDLTADDEPHTDEDVTGIATDKVNGLTATDHTGAFPIRQPM